MRQNKDTAILTLFTLLAIPMLASLVQAAPTIDDYIRIVGPANYSCFGYQPTCMEKTVELCNPGQTTVTLDKDTFRYDFGAVENLQSAKANLHVNDITSVRQETDYTNMTCKVKTRNNQTGDYEDTPAPCMRSVVTTAPNLTITPLSINAQGRLASAISMPANRCMNITLQPSLTQEQRAQSRIEYNITFLNFVLDPFVSKYNLSQDFNNTDELNMTAPTVYNAIALNGTLYSNWTLDRKYLNATSDSPWNCSSTYPIYTSGTGVQGCLGTYENTDTSGDASNEWVMNCGGTCVGAAVQIRFDRNVTILGIQTTHRRAEDLTPKMEVYITNRSHFALGNGMASCTSAICENMTFANYTNDLVWNGSIPISVGGANYTINITPRIGEFIIFRFWGMNGGAVNPRIAEVKPIIANFTSSSSAASITYNLSANMSRVKFAINRTLYQGTVGINLSCDGTTNWCAGGTANDGGEIECCGATKNDAITYTLSLVGTGNYLRPTIDRIELEAFNTTSSGNTTTEEQARTAIENGIKDNFPSAAIQTDQEVYFKYANNTQRMGTTDKYFTYGNKRWVFNYLTGTDTTLGMSGVGTTVITWENQSLTSTQIQQQVRDLVNLTK